MQERPIEIVMDGMAEFLIWPIIWAEGRGLLIATLMCLLNFVWIIPAASLCAVPMLLCMILDTIVDIAEGR